MNTIKINAGNTKMVAHRGVSGLETENTCAAFVAAGNRSHFGVETDIHITGDEDFIVIHDKTTERVASDCVNVEHTTFESLRKLVLKNKNGLKDRADLHLPSLEEYIGICKHYDKVAVLELKTGFSVEQLQRMVARIEAMEYLDKVVFISFVYDNIAELRSFLPEQPCQFLTSKFDDEIYERLVNDKVDLDINHVSLTKEIVDQMHAAGREVNCWTVDDPERAEELVSWGVDYITSNILEAKNA
jgi:glycerophosphoryl diester phosphodiesterase